MIRFGFIWLGFGKPGLIGQFLVWLGRFRLGWVR